MPAPGGDEGTPASTPGPVFTNKLDVQNYERLTTLDDQALSGRIGRMSNPNTLLSFIKVAEACGKPHLAQQAKQRLQTAASKTLSSPVSSMTKGAASKFETPLEPWLQNVHGSAESVEAFTTVSQVLGMSLTDFTFILKGRSYLLSKPVLAVLRPNAEALVQRLGSREAAQRVVMKVPDALVVRAACDDVAYLKKELGWDVENSFPLGISVSKNRPIISGHFLAGPMLQRLLWLCQEELGLSPSAMRQHVDVLRYSKQAITRLAFVSSRRLHSKIKDMKLTDGTVAKDTTFLTEDNSDWRRRLGRWAVSLVLWDSFRAAFLAGADWEALEREDAEYSRMVEQLAIGDVEERVQKAVEVASKGAGTNKVSSKS